MSNKIYDIAKWGALIAIPAIAAFSGVVLPEMGIAAETTKSIVVVVNATGVLIGTLIGVSTVQYNNQNQGLDYGIDDDIEIEGE